MTDKKSNKQPKIYVPKYVSKNLGKDEKILVAERTSAWLYMPLCIFAFLFVIVPCLISCILDGNCSFVALFFSIFILWYWLSNKCKEMAVTNKKIILKKGIFIHSTDELRLEKVESSNIKKSLLGLIFGYGTIIFTGTGNRIIKFDGIKHPQEVKNAIDEVFEKYGK